MEPGFSSALLSLALAGLAITVSPGPATIGVTAVSGAYGFRRALPYVIGSVAGTIAVLLAVAAGLASVLVSRPQLLPPLVLASATYILWLAVRIATAPPLPAEAPQAAAPAFGAGFAVAVLNPKAYLALAAVFAGSTLGLRPAAAETVVKCAVLAATIVFAHCAWLVAGASFAQALRRPEVARVVNRLLAALLVASTLPALLSPPL